MAKNFGARKNAQYKVVSSSPSVNKTPRGPSIVDVPYDVQQDLSGAEGVSPNVNFNGDPVYVKTSHSVKVTGDKEGSKGGVKSGTVGAQSDPIEASPSVFVNGKAVVRVGDVQHMQNKNTVGKVVSSENGSAAHITDEGKIEGNTRPEPLTIPYPKNKPTNNTGSGSLGSRTGSPVLLASGKLLYTHCDTELIAPIPFGIRRTYISTPFRGIFGNGWQLAYETRLDQSGSDSVRIFTEDDRVFCFDKSPEGFIDSDAMGAALTRLAPNSFLLEYHDDARSERYDNGYLSELKERNGNTLTFIRNSDGRIAKLFSSNASLSFEYNLEGYVSRITDHTERVWNYTYDRHGNLERITDPMGGVVQYRYGDNAPYYLERIIDPSGVCILEVSYDVLGRVESYRERGKSFSYRYEPNRVVKTDITGDKRFYGVDGFGAISAITYPDGSTTKEIYENNISMVIDEGGNRFVREFDERGRIIREARLGNLETLYSYEGDNPYESIKNDNGKITAYTYDTRYNRLTATDPEGKIESWSYDDRGNKTAYTDTTGVTTEYAYNALGLCIRSTDALGGMTQYVYDDLGNMTALVDPEERITRFEYDKLSRLIAMTGTDAKTTRFYYDNAGRMIAVRDPQNRMTRYTYDEDGMLSRIIDSESQASIFVYERGQLVSVTPDRGESYRYAYDTRGRMVERSVGNQTTRYTYDSAGNLLGADDGENRIEYVYDGNANVVLERQGEMSVSYAYNPDGTRRFIGYEGTHHTLSRNSGGTLSRIGVGSESYTFSYDPSGRQTALLYPNGIEMKSVFDPLGRLIVRSVDQTALGEYAYDRSSRLVMKNTLPITYDAGCRVIGAGSERYCYDDGGNLTGTDGIVDPITGLLMRQGEIEFIYDTLGRLCEKKSPEFHTLYRYDGEGRLIGYSKTQGADETRMRFSYDPLGRRVTKYHQSREGEYHHRYLYAGDDIVAIRDADTGELIATILHDEGIDTPLSISVHPTEPLNAKETERYESMDETERYLFERSRIRTYYYHRDYQNSIMALSDQSGEIIESYEYDAYGNITRRMKNIQTHNPYGYTGRKYDAPDLYYYRARYYDPTIGRFITPDPIGFMGGDTNFYRYVGNDPVNFIDPSGLSGLTALLDQHNPLKDLVEWWSSTPDTSIPQASIPNSTIPTAKTGSVSSIPKSIQKTVKTSSKMTCGVKVNGDIAPIVDEKCKDQKWHDPIDNPQLAKYNINGVNRPWSNTFGMVRIQNNHPKKHQGVDLFALPGTPVYACVDGIISASIAGVSGYGNIIVLKAKCPDFVRSRKRAYDLQYVEQGEMEHGPNFNDQGQFYFMYAHLLERIVDMGAHVKAGQIIGKIGTSGYTISKDPHLHFEISNIGQIGGGLNNKVNPAFYVGYKLPNELTSTDNILQNNVATSPMGDPRHGDPSLLK